MQRREDWPEILAVQIKAAEMRPFCWGSHDCCAFAARVVQAMTGVDFMADFPEYADEARAQALIAEYGGVQGIAGLCLGAPIAPAFAQRGDVVLMPTEKGDALGICIDHRAVFASGRGLAFCPMAACRQAWRV